MTGAIRLASPPWHRRLLGAAAAAAASSLLIFGLDSAAPPAGGPKVGGSAAPITVWLRPVAKLSAERRIAAPQRKVVPAADQRERRTKDSAPPRPTTTIRLITAPSLPAHVDRAAAVSEPVAAASPSSAASMPMQPLGPKPLRLDAGVLRSASTASRGSVRLMADAAGRPVDSTLAAERSRWSRAIDSSARPDCLAPNEQASLLSAFSIAARAVSGRCP